MWLQVKVQGVPATEILPRPDGVKLARRIADAAYKVHSAGIEAERSHTCADEVRILHQRLPQVARMKPEWVLRLERIMEASDRLGASMRAAPISGIHRDFYPAQILVDGGRLWLLDFDLFCKGDPALDIGNFIGHLTEQSLRLVGEPNAMADREKIMEDRFVELHGEEARRRVRVYHTLTLVRHIQLSTDFPDRRPFTERLLELCERRLAL